MSGKKYKQHYANDDGYSEWETPVMTDYKLCCCDCGLVHNMDFKVLKVTETFEDGTWNAETPDGDYRVEFRVSRNNRSTGQVRRHLTPTERAAARNAIKVLHDKRNSKKEKVARGETLTQTNTLINK